MSSEPQPRASLTSLGSALWTMTSASVLAEIFLVLAPPTDDPLASREVVHPGACRACIASRAHVGPVFDAAQDLSEPGPMPTGPRAPDGPR
jgi:hypothetical protein